MAFFGAPLKMLYGFHQINKASKGLRELSRQGDPQYADPGAVLAGAEAAVKRGFSQAEEAAFNQDLTRANNASYQKATDTNPNLANQIQAGINYGNLSALNEFAAKNADLRRQKVHTLTQSTLSQSNLNTADAIERRRRMQEEYAAAKQAGIANVMGFFDQIDRDAATLTSLVAGGAFGELGDGQGGNYESWKKKKQGTVDQSTAISSTPQGVPQLAGFDQWARNLYGDPGAQFRGTYTPLPGQRPGPVGFYNAPVNPLMPGYY